MTEILELLISEAVELTGTSPPELLSEDAPVLSDQSLQAAGDDSIYLVGIIGGKDVGKSSLVNALVGQEITPPTSHGPGTERVIAYTHREAAEEVRLLLDRELPAQFTIIVHTTDSLRRQVLLDLPDVDSRWSDHILITRKMLRHILYPVWVQSIEKYADLAPQQLLAKVAAGNDPANFVFCMNKVDQLLVREGNAALEELGEDFASRIARTLGMSNRPRVYLISATHAEHGELSSLRQLLSREKSTEVVRQSRQLAIRRKDRSLLEWLDGQRLGERAAQLARLQRDAEELTAARIGQPLLERAIPRLMDDPGHRLALLDPALHKRLSRWPIVNVLDAVFSPLLSLLRINLSTNAASAGGDVDAYLTDDARTVASLVQSTFAQLHQTNPLLGELYRHHKLWDELPSQAAAGELRRRLGATIDRQREAAVERAAGRYGIIRPVFRWLLTIGAILWFPFIQPVLQAWLEPGFAKTARELLYLGVQMIGVTYLLKNVTFLLIWFVALWMILRFSTQRRVNRQIEQWQSSVDSRDQLSLSGQALAWMDELLDPIRTHRQRIESIVRRADELRASLHRGAAA